MSVHLGEQILAVLKEGLSAWKTFIETRQEAYNRKKDKKLHKALEYGERYIRLASTTDLGALDELKKLEDKFFKYNN